MNLLKGGSLNDQTSVHSPQSRLRSNKRVRLQASRIGEVQVLFR